MRNLKHCGRDNEIYVGVDAGRIFHFPPKRGVWCAALPLLSRDLNPLEFFFCGQLKSLLYGPVYMEPGIIPAISKCG
ncbi:hypothetical protein TNCV_3590911 [Trichonephila clavipes]|nr:hypothetical protein TNCV_3590911 [Trichonephila clavipes]